MKGTRNWLETVWAMRNSRPGSFVASAGFRECKKANPTAAMSTVLACIRVLPVMAMGPTARQYFWMRGFSKTRRERSTVAINWASGLQ